MYEQVVGIHMIGNVCMSLCLVTYICVICNCCMSMYGTCKSAGTTRVDVSV